jgi:hypothetical protein
VGRASDALRIAEILTQTVPALSNRLRAAAAAVRLNAGVSGQVKAFSLGRFLLQAKKKQIPRFAGNDNFAEIRLTH